MKEDGTERVDYEYDPNGNLTVKVVTKEETITRWEYTYDLLNQLEQVEKNGEVVSIYTYDPNGFRVEKVGSKGKIHYVPLLNGEAGYRKEFSTNTEYSFIYVGGQHFARVDGVIGGNGKKYFYHNDHLGSALAVSDESGNKVVERDFTPFGERINVDIYDETNRDPVEDDSGFTGKDWDADVELYYFNARWYDPGVGRFISQDPAEDDPTLYVYGFNNPMMFVDPSGMIALDIPGGIMGMLQNIPVIGNLLQGLNSFKLMIGGKTGSDIVKDTGGKDESEQPNPIIYMVNGINNPRDAETGEGTSKDWAQLRNTFEEAGYDVRILEDVFGEKYDKGEVVSSANDALQVAGEVTNLYTEYSEKLAELVHADIKSGRIKENQATIFFGYSGGGEVVIRAAAALEGIRKIDAVVTVGSQLNLFSIDPVLSKKVINHKVGWKQHKIGYMDMGVEFNPPSILTPSYEAVSWKNIGKLYEFHSPADDFYPLKYHKELKNHQQIILPSVKHGYWDGGWSEDIKWKYRDDLIYQYLGIFKNY